VGVGRRTLALLAAGFLDCRGSSVTFQPPAAGTRWGLVLGSAAGLQPWAHCGMLPAHIQESRGESRHTVPLPHTIEPGSRGTWCCSHIGLVPCRGLLGLEWVSKSRSKDAPATGGRPHFVAGASLLRFPRSGQARWDDNRDAAQEVDRRPQMSPTFSEARQYLRN